MLSRLVIGIGNRCRRDDGVGLVVAECIARQELSGVCVLPAIGEPGAILDAWAGVLLAVVVDAALGDGAVPGRIRRWTPGEADGPGTVSSHGFGLAQTCALAAALGLLPARLVAFTVDITDAGVGVGLTPAVAAAVPDVVTAVVTELDM
jgi:hydrogenase maturation protease